MKGRRFLFGLAVAVFLGYTALTKIESESFWAHLFAWIPILAFAGRMVYGIIKGK